MPEMECNMERNEKLIVAVQSVARAAGADSETIARLASAAKGGAPDNGEKYMRTREVAAALECHPRSVFRYAARGLLHPVRRSARAIRWRKSEVERLAGGVAQ